MYAYMAYMECLGIAIYAMTAYLPKTYCPLPNQPTWSCASGLVMLFGIPWIMVVLEQKRSVAGQGSNPKCTYIAQMASPHRGFGHDNKFPETKSSRI